MAGLSRSNSGDAINTEICLARQNTNLSNLPPTYIYLGDIDLFMEENINYAKRLIVANVPTDLHVYRAGVTDLTALALRQD